TLSAGLVCPWLALRDIFERILARLLPLVAVAVVRLVPAQTLAGMGCRGRGWVGSHPAGRSSSMGLPPPSGGLWVYEGAAGDPEHECRYHQPHRDLASRHALARSATDHVLGGVIVSGADDRGTRGDRERRCCTRMAQGDRCLLCRCDDRH